MFRSFGLCPVRPRLSDQQGNQPEKDETTGEHAAIPNASQATAERLNGADYESESIGTSIIN